MESYQNAGKNDLTGGGNGHRTIPPSLPHHSSSSVDLSMQSNTTVAGRDVNISITAERPRKDSIPDQRMLANWVSPLNHHKIHKDVFEKVVKGTGSWILERPKFQEWLHKELEVNILWGTGIPGAGKTCLTSVVVEHLKERQATVVYVYCQYNDKLSLPDILGCMLKQMIERSQEAAQYVWASLYKDCLSTETKPSQSELLTTLRGVAHLFPNLFVVVDALDELRDETRLELIDSLISLRQSLFMTSRPLVDFPIQKEPDFIIRAPDDDLHTYISTRIASIPKLNPFFRGPGVREEILNKLKVRCDGMFLLAALQLDALASAGIIDTKGLRNAVEHLPTSLYARYELTLERIKEAQNVQERDLALRVFLFITHATRILHVAELLDALMVDFGMASLEEERRTAEETLKGVCMGLVTIEKENKTVQLIHYTAQEFFQGRKDSLMLSNPHAYIAGVSAIYITHANIDSSTLRSEDDLRSTKPSYPFFYYACTNLGHHTYRACCSGKGTIPEQVHRLFKKRRNVPLPLTALGNYIDHGEAIHFASLYGIESLFKDQINVVNINRHSVLGCSSLFYACLGGHTALVERVLGLPAARLQIGTPTRFGATPLHAACQNGQLSVVQLLLPMISRRIDFLAGVQCLVAPSYIDISAQMSDGRMALHIASENGHDSVVKALLSVLGSFKTKARTRWRSSHGSFLGGYRPRFWLEPGRDDIVNAKEKNGRTALHLAAQNGHDAVVRSFLLSKDIEVNATEGDGWTPLHFASRNGNQEVMRVLLNRSGILVNAQARNGWTPLHHAVRKGHNPVVRLLLNSPNTKVNAKNADNWTPLHVAVLNRHHSVVQLLLESAGIDVNARIKDGWTPLHITAQTGYERVAQLLLGSIGIEVNGSDKGGRRPLHLSAREGHNSVTQLLLNVKGIEVNPRDKGGWTPLHYAASEGHESVVCLLLNSIGIEVNAKTTSGATSLHKAAQNGHGSVVQLLLNSAGVEINSREEDGWTPLHFAAREGHEAVVQSLLEFPGVDPHIRGTGQPPWNQMPLEAARSEGQHRIVALFEEMGFGTVAASGMTCNPSLQSSSCYWEYQ